jgi:hypothetical protein
VVEKILYGTDAKCVSFYTRVCKLPIRRKTTLRTCYINCYFKSTRTVIILQEFKINREICNVLTHFFTMYIVR